MEGWCQCIGRYPWLRKPLKTKSVKHVLGGMVRGLVHAFAIAEYHAGGTVRVSWCNIALWKCTICARSPSNCTPPLRIKLQHHIQHLFLGTGKGKGILLGKSSWAARSRYASLWRPLDNLGRCTLAVPRYHATRHSHSACKSADFFYARNLAAGE